MIQETGRPAKNRMRTERKLIDAVGSIIKNKGFKELGVNAIAREADVNKKLIYRYFGDVDQLIETYLLEKDFWLPLNKIHEINESSDDKELLKSLSCEMLERQLLNLCDDQELQEIARWQIAKENGALKRVRNLKEIQASPFFESSANCFRKSTINFRAVSGILMSAICFMVLSNGNTEMYGLNLKSADGKKEVLRTLNQILDSIFEKY